MTHPKTDLAGSKATPTYQTTLAYDSGGHLSTVTDPGHRTYTLTWSGNHIIGLIDSAGRQVDYGYNAAGDLTDVYGVGTTRTPTRADDDHTQYTYDGHHLMTSMRSPNNFGGPAGAATTMVYDTAERVHTQTDADGDVTTFTYGPDGGLSAGQVLVTDPSGHKTLDTYQNGLLVSETHGYGTSDAGTSSYTYDPVTLGVSTQTDPDGGFETFTYDDHGNKSSESNALGYTTNYSYDDAGNVIETIDPNGIATVNQYDQAGQIPASANGIRDLTSTTTTQVDNVVESTTGNFGTEPVRTVTYHYDDPAHPADRTRTTDPRNNTTTETYDAYGDNTSSSDPLGDTTKYGYDTNTGQRTSSVDPNGTAAGVTPSCAPPATGCTTFTLNAKGQLLQTTDALGHTTKNTYDSDGNKTSATDANNHATTYTYDPADRMTTTTMPDNSTRKTDYNPDGTIADTIDGVGARTSFGYDGQGRSHTRTDPDNRTITTNLDHAGRVHTIVDAAGRTTTMGYDLAGELASVSYSDGATPGVTYDYDPAGQRVDMTDGTGTSTWTYNAFGEVTESQQGSGSTVTYGYDDAGNQNAITYPGQSAAVARAFDPANRLTSVTDTAGNATTFGYTRDSDVLTTTYPNGATVTNGYDTADRLHTTVATTGSTTDVTQTFDRDPLGQLTTESTGATSKTYGYSSREQLSSVTTAGNTAGYGTDPADNPTTVGTATQTFDPAGQLCWTLPTGTTPNPACTTAPTGATGYTYNTQAQRTAATPASGPATTEAYDQAGHLTTFTGPAGTATYRYDGLGQRASKTTATSTTAFTWDGSSTPNLLFDGTTAYLYGPDGLPIEQTGPTGANWFVHNNIGSTIALLTNTGTVGATYAYSPYGTPSHTGTATTSLQYTGQYLDSESGFLYLHARYYDPTTATFLTVDPDVDTTHAAYAYAGDNPVNASDPGGLASLCTYAQEKHDPALIARDCKAPTQTPDPNRCPRINEDGLGCADATWNQAHPFSQGTSGVCLGGTLAVGVGVTGNICLAATGSSIGVTGSCGIVLGVSGEFGLTGFTSNAKKISDLTRGFGSTSGSGLGPFGVSDSWGPSDDGFVNVLGLAVGLGAGFWTGPTYTWLILGG
ncbi:RHS repeat-associated core domain-containing protein [Amycolatopsis sp. NPDC049253]|uniref:RHS repeat-associated core domain-containing protein n=1 Tax=Amycolatopsis sp. NPDC049253 TaxID=3155274 RepID=UPI003412130B